jgi:hypothetical protein
LLASLLALMGGFGVQQASAQTFTNLTSVLILRQMPLNETEIKSDMQGLQQKLWQIRNESSRSSGQLALLSPRSRAKLNTMTGATLEVSPAAAAAAQAAAAAAAQAQAQAAGALSRKESHVQPGTHTADSSTAHVHFVPSECC